ncbi:MAG: hypothetical protein LBT87_00950 [Treponema sp.]|jgi:hypothetical protein|nr:hypothetical protein [Treponema sp.]
MDSTTKQRYISTSIWSDEWFDSLSTLEKLIYFHLLTNEFTNAAGVYHISLKQIRVDMDISRDEVRRALDKFEAAGKAYYFQEYVIIPKWLKHQKISERSKMFLGALSVLRGLPDDVKRFISERSHYDFPVEKYVEIPPNDRLCPVEDRLSPPEDSLCRKDGKKGIAYAENAANSAHDSDSDSDSYSGGGRSDYSDPPGGKNPAPEEPPPPQLQNIINLSEKAGFPLDVTGARKVIAQNLDPAWFDGQFTFLEYLAEVVKAKCPQNPKGMFFEAIGWKDIRPGFLHWRKLLEDAAKQEAAERLKARPPDRCPGCGAPLNGKRLCESCGGAIRFEQGAWKCVPPLDVSLAKVFRDALRSRGSARAPPGKPDGIVF